VTIEEFHCKLQEATNFPLRPFVIPFLKVTGDWWGLPALPAPACATWQRVVAGKALAASTAAVLLKVQDRLHRPWRWPCGTASWNA